MTRVQRERRPASVRVGIEHLRGSRLIRSISFYRITAVYVILAVMVIALLLTL